MMALKKSGVTWILLWDGDEFGMESGGWCWFTRSLPIIYLQMWLNEKTNLTQFVSWQVP
jgi:hypothetical protein